METNQLTSGAYFKSMQIVYYALFAGPLFMGIILFFLYQTGSLAATAQDLRDIFIYIVPLFAVGGLVSSNLMFRSLLTKIKSRQTLKEKMTEYRSALVVRYALLEGSSFFSIVAYLLTGDILFLGIAGLIILYFLLLKPTIARAVKDLELNPDDEHSLNDPDKVIFEFVSRNQ